MLYFFLLLLAHWSIVMHYLKKIYLPEFMLMYISLLSLDAVVELKYKATTSGIPILKLFSFQKIRQTTNRNYTLIFWLSYHIFNYNFFITLHENTIPLEGEKKSTGINLVTGILPKKQTWTSYLSCNTTVIK